MTDSAASTSRVYWCSVLKFKAIKNYTYFQNSRLKSVLEDGRTVRQNRPPPLQPLKISLERGSQNHSSKGRRGLLNVSGGVYAANPIFQTKFKLK